MLYMYPHNPLTVFQAQLRRSESQEEQHLGCWQEDLPQKVTTQCPAQGINVQAIVRYSSSCIVAYVLVTEGIADTR